MSMGRIFREYFADFLSENGAVFREYFADIFSENGADFCEYLTDLLVKMGWIFSRLFGRFLGGRVLLGWGSVLRGWGRRFVCASA